jgi:hypothetical protein
MKNDSGYGKKPSNSEKNDETTISLANERRPGTVVGFRPDVAIAPWSRWANRFIIAAIAQGAIAVGVTAYLLYDALFDTPGASRIVAAGGAGTWLTVGYLGFIVFGPLAAAVTSLFYQHLEAHLQAPYSGLSNVFAWLHLLLMNIGIAGATLIMMNGGWRAGALIYTLQNDPSCKATPPPSTCSLGYINGQAHVQVLGSLPPYIAAFAAIAIIGAIAGGLGYVIAWQRSRGHRM